MLSRKGHFWKISICCSLQKSDQSADEKQLARVFTDARRSVAIAERRMLAYPTEIES